MILRRMYASRAVRPGGLTETEEKLGRLLLECFSVEGQNLAVEMNWVPFSPNENGKSVPDNDRHNHFLYCRPITENGPNENEQLKVSSRTQLRLARLINRSTGSQLPYAVYWVEVTNHELAAMVAGAKPCVATI